MRLLTSRSQVRALLGALLHATEWACWPCHNHTRVVTGYGTVEGVMAVWCMARVVSGQAHTTSISITTAGITAATVVPGMRSAAGTMTYLKAA